MASSGACTVWMNSILAHMFGASTLTSPSTLYFGICDTVSPEGIVVGEPTEGSYARKGIVNNSALWNEPLNGIVTNKDTITFTLATGSWGVSKSTFFIADHPTLSGVHIIGYGLLTEAKTIVLGDIAQFEPGMLSITLLAT